MYPVIELLVLRGSAYLNIKMEMMLKRLMNRLNFQQWLSVSPNLWYRVLFKKIIFLKFMGAIRPCYWSKGSGRGLETRTTVWLSYTLKPEMGQIPT